ncbi:MAG: ABC transporter permease subunit [Acidimicrobiales bacterium]
MATSTAAAGPVVGGPGQAASSAGHPPARRRRQWGWSQEGAIFKNRWLPYALIVPQLIITAVFFLWPTIRAIYESLQRSNAFGLGAVFSGLANFATAVTQGGELNSLIVTLVFAAVTTALAMAIGLFLAVQVEQVGRSKVIYRTLFIWTYAVPGAIAGALWLFLFQPGIGPGAHFLTALGVNWNFALHGNQAFALIVVLVVWQQSAYNFLFFSAGLQIIPAQIVEAASVDGAGKLARFWRIVFPLLSPTTFFLVVLDILYAFFSSFAIIDVVTAGGPGTATTTLVYQLYRDGFQNSNTGLAGAETVVLLVIAGIITVVQFRYLNRKVHYR